MSSLERRMVVVSNQLPVTIDDCAGVRVGWTGTDASPAIEAVLEGVAPKPV
jgi:hypothetical protein